MSSDTPTVDPDLPPVDERIAPVDKRYEVWDGELVYVPPPDEPHARLQVKVAVLIEAHVAPGFTVAADMLTRTSRTNDFAPDVSVYPVARDPKTGGRQLEHLAFEVVSTETLSHAGRKASKLIARGVRRMFAIQVARSRMLEWSTSLGKWSVLDPSTRIEDLTLAVPVPISALLTAAAADDEMARALIQKRNPVIEARRVEADRKGWVRGRAKGHLEGKAQGREEGRKQGRKQGRQEALAQALIAALDARGITLRDADRARILQERDAARLLLWIGRAARCRNAREIFAER